MKAVYITSFGGPENLEYREVDDPRAPGSGEVLVRVRAAGLNRADLLQRRGLYPPPEGYSPNIPGLEFAGQVAANGTGSNRFQMGDSVFGITAGEAHAEYVVVAETLLARVPAGLDHTQAAAVPEVFVTAHDALFTICGLKPGDTVLVHAVGSGVGLAALQLAKAAGASVIGTSRSREKLERCRGFKLDYALQVGDPVYFAEAVMAKTNGNGVDIVLDLVGSRYFDENLRSLAVKGRIALVGLTSGRKTEFDMGIALSKRLTISGTTLRFRPLEEKAAAMRVFASDVLPLLSDGRVRPNVDRVFTASEVRAAHAYLESNESFGKVILTF
jgi:putative PIG3 family NAD(P)H quinone oxidoreductase